jgi:septum formation inhibitor-activating ATPase MinD
VKQLTVVLGICRIVNHGLADVVDDAATLEKAAQQQKKKRIIVVVLKSFIIICLWTVCR